MTDLRDRLVQLGQRLQDLPGLPELMELRERRVRLEQTELLDLLDQRDQLVQIAQLLDQRVQPEQMARMEQQDQQDLPVKAQTLPSQLPHRETPPLETYGWTATTDDFTFTTQTAMVHSGLKLETTEHPPQRLSAQQHPQVLYRVNYGSTRKRGTSTFTM